MLGANVRLPVCQTQEKSGSSAHSCSSPHKNQLCDFFGTNNYNSTAIK